MITKSILFSSILVFSALTVAGGNFSSTNSSAGYESSTSGSFMDKRDRRRHKHRYRCCDRSNDRVSLDKPEDTVVGCKGEGCRINYSSKKWKRSRD